MYFVKPTPSVDYGADLLVGEDVQDRIQHRLTVDQVNDWLIHHPDPVYCIKG